MSDISRPDFCGSCERCDGTGWTHAFCPVRGQVMSGDDLLDRAEDLAERYNSSGFIHKEATLLLPELIEEIKRQRERAQKAEAEAARWQAVAKEEHAKVLCAARLSVCCHYDDIDEATMIEEVTDEDRQQAAAALGCSPRAWLMTPERIKALDRAARFIAWADHAGHLRENIATRDADILRAMLAEVKQ